MRDSMMPFALSFLMASVAVYYTVILLDDPIRPAAAATSVTAASLIGNVAVLGSEPTSPTTAAADAAKAVSADAVETKIEPVQLSGEPSVGRDATITIQGSTVRLAGVVFGAASDAVDSDAAVKLKDVIGKSDVHCSALPQAQGDTLEGACWVLSGGHPIDLAAELVLAGVARECASQSNGRYLPFKQMSAAEIDLPSQCSAAPAVAAVAAPVEQTAAASPLKPSQP